MKNSKRKIGRLSLSAGITALVLVGILLLNILFSYIANNRLLYLDVSKEGFSELSAESTELLDKIDPDTTNITIYFLADRDELSSPILGYSSSSGRTTGQNEMWGMRYVHELALAIAAKYDYVSVDYLNMNNDKEMIDTFQTTVGYSFRKSSVVIDNCTYEYDKNGSPLLDENGVHLSHHNYRICSRDAFFTFDEDTGYVYAFNGDLRYTSVILSLSGLSPTVYFLTGHGEKVGDEEENDFGKAQAMRDLLFEAGFTVKKANLVKDYKEVFSDSRARLLDTGKGVYRCGGAAFAALRDSRDTGGAARVLFYGDVDFVQAGGGVEAICIVTFAPPKTAEFSKMIFPLCFFAIDAATYKPIP